MRRLNLDEVTVGWMSEHVTPADWAAATRMHEASHVTLSEALGIPITEVWANVDWNAHKGGGYTNAAANAGAQAAVYYIGGPAQAEELRLRGYDDEGFLYNVENIGGSSDRKKVQQMTESGIYVSTEGLQATVEQILRTPDFQDAAHNVAQALADQGDYLTHEDVVAAMGSYRDNNGLLTPQERALVLPASQERAAEEAERQQRDERYRAGEQLNQHEITREGQEMTL